MTLDNTRWDLTIGNMNVYMNNFWTDFNAGMPNSSHLHIVSHRDQALYEISGIQPRSYYGSQRRRNT